MSVRIFFRMRNPLRTNQEAQEIYNTFKACGELVDFRLKRNNETRSWQKYGFVIYKNSADGERVLLQQQLKIPKLNVEIDVEKSSFIVPNEDPARGISQMLPTWPGFADRQKIEDCRERLKKYLRREPRTVLGNMGRITKDEAAQAVTHATSAATSFPNQNLGSALDAGSDLLDGRMAEGDHEIGAVEKPLGKAEANFTEQSSHFAEKVDLTEKEGEREKSAEEEVYSITMSSGLFRDKAAHVATADEQKTTAAIADSAMRSMAAPVPEGDTLTQNPTQLAEAASATHEPEPSSPPPAARSASPRPLMSSPYLDELDGGVDSPYEQMLTNQRNVVPSGGSPHYVPYDYAAYQNVRNVSTSNERPGDSWVKMLRPDTHGERD